MPTDREKKEKAKKFPWLSKYRFALHHIIKRQLDTIHSSHSTWHWPWFWGKGQSWFWLPIINGLMSLFGFGVIVLINFILWWFFSSRKLGKNSPIERLASLSSHGCGLNWCVFCEMKRIPQFLDILLYCLLVSITFFQFTHILIIIIILASKGNRRGKILLRLLKT